MLMPFEWVVGDSSKDHTVTAPMFYDVLATVRYTTLWGITLKPMRRPLVRTRPDHANFVHSTLAALFWHFCTPTQALSALR